MFENDVDELHLGIPHMPYPLFAQAIGLGAEEFLELLDSDRFVIVRLTKDRIRYRK